MFSKKTIPDLVKKRAEKAVSPSEKIRTFEQKTTEKRKKKKTEDYL